MPGLSLDTATITSGFGYRTIFVRQDFHEGIDIAAHSPAFLPQNAISKRSAPPRLRRAAAPAGGNGGIYYNYGFAQCFRDYRDSSYVDYPVDQLLAQRVYGIKGVDYVARYGK